MIEIHLPAFIAFNYLAFAVFITLLGVWRKELCQPLAVLGAGISSLLSVAGFVATVYDPRIRYFFGNWEPPIGIEFVYDGLAAFIVMVINLVAFFVLIHSRPVAGREFPTKRMAYYTITMLLMLGFNGIVLTGDLFNLYVFLEISSLSMYGLIAIGAKGAPMAAFRYLIVGTIGGSFYLLGLAFFYSVTGTLNLIDMAAMMPEVADSPAVVTGLVLMVVGISTKAALFPMHGWLPDAYSLGSSTSSALIAPIGTKVAAYILIRILLYLFGMDLADAVVPVSLALGVLASIGILYGSIMAIAQTDLKRMLAYSSISQIGYIILGISLANPFGFIGAVFHILNHAVMKACLFMVAGNLQMKEGHTDISRFDHTYRKKYPWTMFAFATAAISMVGLPPLAGFFSKWYLVLGTIENGAWLFLAVILTSSLLNAVYFFRILERVYMKNPKGDVAADNITDVAAGQRMGTEDIPSQEPPRSMVAPVALFALALFIIGFMNVSFVTIISNMGVF